MTHKMKILKINYVTLQNIFDFSPVICESEWWGFSYIMTLAGNHAVLLLCHKVADDYLFTKISIWPDDFSQKSWQGQTKSAKLQGLNI